jgi:hypothetical protein
VPDPWATGNINDMMGQLTATASPTPSDPFAPIQSPTDPGVDWSGLQSFWSGFMQPLQDIAKYLPPYLSKEFGATPEQKLAEKLYEKM